MNDKFVIRKNILDVDLQKNLQIASLTIIVAFTYLIGIAIASITGQINWVSFIHIGILIIISIFVLGLTGFFFILSTNKIKRITKAIRDMEKIV